MKRYVPVMAGILVLLMFGCNLDSLTREETFLEGKVQIEVPALWVKYSNLNEIADFQVGDALEKVFFIVIAEDKTDFEGGMTLEEHSALTRGLLETNAQDTSAVNEPSRLITNSEMPGLQYEIRAKVQVMTKDGAELLDLIYLHTTVEGKNRFYQVVGWALEEDYKANVETLKKIVKSLKEVE